MFKLFVLKASRLKLVSKLFIVIILLFWTSVIERLS